MKKLSKPVKIILSLLLGLLVFLFVVLGVVFLSLDSIIQKSVTVFGSQMTGVKVELKGVSLSIFSPKLELTGLVVGNPKDYSAPEAFRMQRLFVSLDRNSLFTDKIIIHQITIEGAKIDFEPKFNGENNLAAIRKNIESQVPKKDKAKTEEEKVATEPAEKKPGKKMVIELFELKNAQLAVSSSLLGGNAIILPLPDITMRDIGKDQEITSAEAFKQIFTGVFKGVTDAVSGAAQSVPLKDEMNKVGEGAKDAVDKTTEGGKKMINGIKSLF